MYLVRCVKDRLLSLNGGQVLLLFVLFVQNIILKDNTEIGRGEGYRKTEV